MIRILWKMPDTQAWTGGLNYFLNLWNALASLPDRTLEPVLVGTTGQLSLPLAGLSAIPKYSAPVGWGWRGLRRRLEGAAGRPRDYDRFLRRHRIDLLSHLVVPREQVSVPLLAWIPDFQHRHLPHFFSEEEIKRRNQRQEYLAGIAQGILLSSEDARRDFNRFHPGRESKTHVLRFASVPPLPEELPSMESVRERHGIDEPFFHVPNQLWAHKNHAILLEALVLLRRRGRCPLVVSTGQMADYRHPGFGDQLLKKVQEAGLSERFRFLGLIAYPEMCALLVSSVALINPSLFEGWSTTVEEAKSYGKQMLLSRLSVHQEQATGERCVFFDPQNGEELAQRMEEILAGYDPAREVIALQSAVADWPIHIREFGRNYEGIIHRMLGRTR